MRKRKLLDVGIEKFNEDSRNWYVDFGAERLACQSFAAHDAREVFIFLNADTGLPSFKSLTQAAPVSERKICTRGK